MHAAGHQRPPVVPAPFDQVDLVAAAGAVFGAPEPVGGGVMFQTLGNAVPERPDRLDGAFNADERVARRNASVFSDAVNLAPRCAQFLDSKIKETVLRAHREIDVTVTIEREAPTQRKIRTRRVVFVGAAPDRLFIRPRAIADSPANDPGHGDRHVSLAADFVAVFATVAVVQVDPAVLLVVRMKRRLVHPAQSAIQCTGAVGNRAVVVDPRRPGNHLGLVTVGRDEAQAPFLLREEQSAVGQGRDRKRQRRQVFDEWDQDEVMMRAAVNTARNPDFSPHAVVIVRVTLALFENVDGEALDLVRQKDSVVGGHFRLGIADANTRLQRLAGIATHKFSADQRSTECGAFQRGAVTGGTDFLIQIAYRTVPRLCERRGTSYQKSRHDGGNMTIEPPVPHS